MLLVLAVTALLLGGLGFVKFRQVKSGMAAQASFQPPPEAVTTTVAREEAWPATISAIGSVVAIRGVTVSADLPGIVQKISFESGASVAAGVVLVQLDTQQEQAQLADANAQRELANANYARMGELVKQGVISRQEYDRATAEQRAGDAKVAEIRATIARKTIRAPFSGSLGIRQVNLGQYLSAGSPIVPLQALDPIYVNFSLPQQVVGRLKPGQTVHVSPDDGTHTDFAGRVTAIDSVVDPATRNVQVQATFPNRERRLHPGMFVQIALALGSSESVITLPASAISYAPYGDSVFVVADLKGPKGETYRGVRQQFVKLGAARGDQVAVTSGVKSGDEVVTSGAFKLRNGASVSPNNKVQPSNSATPKVEDR
ncbi:MAG: efflux RND transporter periplasmic adaptor subunit [Candidatus Koribacter versatilis]|uniref:Efflux RND transporter periplasmic adaptor subunit n=1 Tax=Candidatus Korobacter versatilis TaxID=658062 RepID=A0A932A934_9BACT|nr:efflux RND transporter periplasmic adaptor subunit [Candidatus Koribacter versatilis]